MHWLQSTRCLRDVLVPPHNRHGCARASADVIVVDVVVVVVVDGTLAEAVVVVIGRVTVAVGGMDGGGWSRPPSRRRVGLLPAGSGSGPSHRSGTARECGIARRRSETRASVTPVPK